MELGYIGLGKMGINMVRRLIEKGHRVTVFDRNKAAIVALAGQGAKPADSVKTLVASLSSPKLLWLMVPHQAVDAVLAEVTPLLSRGDTIIDGGNSPYRESMRRAAELEAKGLAFLDAGVSGGPSGARNGACVMVGGRKEIFQKYEGLFRDLSVEKGYAYLGKAGAGHFVKMVHNGIEYGMMQALAEGFAILNASSFDLDLESVAELYNRRSVIESRLVEWLKGAFEQYGTELDEISGSVEQSGEGLWTVEAAKELGIEAPIIQGALDYRLQTQKDPTYTGKLLSAMRNQFGGHEVARAKALKVGHA